MKYYHAKWKNPTELYHRWDGVPHLLIHNKEYVVSVEKDGVWPYLVTVYTLKGKQITKIPYNCNPNEFWEILSTMD